jgi:selenocysteine lyase/cysteine desulfurase
MNNLDVSFVRKQFPVFDTELGKKIAFFDNGGGSYVAGSVIKKLSDFYTNYKVQPYGSTTMGKLAGDAMDYGRSSMAELLNIPIDQLTIGASTTQNINTLSIACSPIVSSNSEVIVSEQDHEANIGGWERLCKKQGAQFTLWKVDPTTGELDLNTLEKLISEKTAIVAVTQSSNILGSINPVNEIATIARKNNARFVVDAVAYAPHQWPNLDEIDADAYVFSSYKTYGTHQGIMVVRPDFLSELDKQCHFFNEKYIIKWLDSSGPNHAAIAALGGIADYFSTIYDHHFEDKDLPLYSKARAMSLLMHKHESELCQTLLDCINELPIKIYGKNKMQRREANIALVSNQFSSLSLMEELGKSDIIVKQGNFYAYRLLHSLGVSNLNDGVLRISLSHYNTLEEVERCCHALNNIHE